MSLAVKLINTFSFPGRVVERCQERRGQKEKLAKSMSDQWGSETIITNIALFLSFYHSYLRLNAYAENHRPANDARAGRGGAPTIYGGPFVNPVDFSRIPAYTCAWCRNSYPIYYLRPALRYIEEHYRDISMEGPTSQRALRGTAASGLSSKVETY
ncbi:hypothetical protein EVAR_34814_1 [Eumeta japonica]|uniref:Uncharacterized protein n=1 Tax=Eumeta variegata TaxID=151549 RepID=A0A4C1WB84_EUMVA|nr:hypothetical protein EVAR_34814_1 [Eumeta japonica]